MGAIFTVLGDADFYDFTRDGKWDEDDPLAEVFSGNVHLGDSVTLVGK